jgi:lycopene cyclase domain-containing protein
VWGFNYQYTLGIKIFNLPMEELLFFICIPFSCVFTYYCLKPFLKAGLKPIWRRIIILSTAFVLLVAGLFNIEKDYTSSAFISTAILLVFLEFIFKAKWLFDFLSIYPLLLIPFFIVNGILTGSGLEQPVVWYNNLENMNIRLFTIPLEDVVYGLELLLLNVFFYENFETAVKFQTNSYHPAMNN